MKHTHHEFNHNGPSNGPYIFGEFMSPTWLYGIVIDNNFFSNLMQWPVSNAHENGLYRLDIAAETPVNSLEPASMDEFEKFVKKSKHMEFVRGYSFKSGIIPTNIMAWKHYTLPIGIIDSVADEWSFIKVLYIPKRNFFYYINTLDSNLQLKLIEVSNAFVSNIAISNIKEVTPEIRFLFVLHSLERIQQEKERRQQEYAEKLKTVEGRIAFALSQSGGELISYKEVNGIGYEIQWKAFGERIKTLVNHNFAVLEAGFCVSGYDRTQSMTSVVKLLNDYKDQGDRIVITRR